MTNDQINASMRDGNWHTATVHLTIRYDANIIDVSDLTPRLEGLLLADEHTGPAVYGVGVDLIQDEITTA